MNNAFTETNFKQIQTMKFNSFALARSFSYRTVKASAVMHGCDGKFWVVSLSDMTRMIRAGYEVAA